VKGATVDEPVVQFLHYGNLHVAPSMNPEAYSVYNNQEQNVDNQPVSTQYYQQSNIADQYQKL
jgi:hypothetical protein